MVLKITLVVVGTGSIIGKSLVVNQFPKFVLQRIAVNHHKLVLMFKKTAIRTEIGISFHFAILITI